MGSGSRLGPVNHFLMFLYIHTTLRSTGIFAVFLGILCPFLSLHLGWYFSLHLERLLLLWKQMCVLSSVQVTSPRKSSLATAVGKEERTWDLKSGLDSCPCSATCPSVTLSKSPRCLNLFRGSSPGCQSCYMDHMIRTAWPTVEAEWMFQVVW